jgi:hypothetical protein
VLRECRRGLAASAKGGEGVPAFCVCSDATLREVARLRDA